MSVGLGLRVIVEMMESELTAQVGPKPARIPERTASRHASAPGSVVLGGRRVPISRPRARTVDGAEVQLETYATFAADDLLTHVVLERMLAGVATRRHRAVAEPVGTAVEAEAASTSLVGVPAVQGGHGQRAGGADVAGPERAGGGGHDDRRCDLRRQCCAVALAICTDGTKVPGGPRGGRGRPVAACRCQVNVPPRGARIRSRRRRRLVYAPPAVRGVPLPEGCHTGRSSRRPQSPAPLQCGLGCEVVASQLSTACGVRARRREAQAR